MPHMQPGSQRSGSLRLPALPAPTTPTAVEPDLSGLDLGGVGGTRPSAVPTPQAPAPSDLSNRAPRMDPPFRVPTPMPTAPAAPVPRTPSAPAVPAPAAPTPALPTPPSVTPPAARDVGRAGVRGSPEWVAWHAKRKAASAARAEKRASFQRARSQRTALRKVATRQIPEIPRDFPQPYPLPTIPTVPPVRRPHSRR